MIINNRLMSFSLLLLNSAYIIMRFQFENNCQMTFKSVKNVQSEIYLNESTVKPYSSVKIAIK